MHSKNIIVHVLLTYLLINSFGSASNIYKCTNSLGKLTYKDTPCINNHKNNHTINIPSKKLNDENSSNKSSSYNALAFRTHKAQTIIDNYYGSNRHTLNEATQIIAGVINEDASFSPAYIEMARLVLNKGFIVNDSKFSKWKGNTIEQAYEIAKHAIELDPKYAESYVLMGHVEFLRGNNPQAMKNYEIARKFGSVNPWINNHIGAIYLNRKNYKEADSYYEKTIKLGMGNTAQQRSAFLGALSKQMTMSYFQTHNTRLYELATQINNLAPDDDAWTWSNTGGLLCRSGFLDYGTKNNRKALSIMSYGVARYNLAFCLYGKWAREVIDGNLSSSTKYFDEAYSIDSNVKKFADAIAKSDIAYLKEPLVKKAKELSWMKDSQEL